MSKRMMEVSMRLWIPALLLAWATPVLGSEQVDFERDIVPIFEERCSFCHGEDEQESGFRLDQRAKMLRGGDSGLSAVVPGQPEKSYLIEVVKHLVPDVQMPPDEDRIPDEEIELLERWIQQGAIWPGQMDAAGEDEVDHWAFEPLPTQFKHDGIDAFLEDKLTSAGLEFSAPAEPRALIRRVSIILSGLAPTPERADAFVEAFAVNPDEAYEALVDELLQSPHFGERWAQHWLDVIRWAETNGSESNMYRKNAWMYRDYVVRSLNEDKPYDQFIREQLAGDTMGAGDATGFLVAGPHVPSATVGFEPTAIRQARADRMDEVLQTVGASMMGMTIGCARCHNHKFDPISITDYYSLSAVFQDIEFGGRFPELAADHPRSIREAELQGRLDELRDQMRAFGWGWIEDWEGYQEVRFPRCETKSLRLSFSRAYMVVDELEVFEAGPQRRNLALAKYGTRLSENSATIQEGKQADKLINGVFGAKQFVARSPKGSQERPWLEFEFTESMPVDTIRISTNREDFLETDYLIGMNKNAYGDFTIDLPDKEGVWKPLASTAMIKKRSADNQDRRAIQAKIQDVINEMLVHGRQPAFVARFIEPVETFVLARGSPESPRDRVDPAAPKVLGGGLPIEADAPGPERRRALADWLTDSANPLTPRVMANRIWHHTFGSGIVPTPSDFGAAGAPPTHPELLDWLSNEFVHPTATVSGAEPIAYSIKRLVRMLVLSKAFRQSSQPDRDGLDKDASGQLLWRFPPRRVEAEVIRDSILQASGTLDRTIGGPSYRIHNVKKRYAQWEVVDNHGAPTWRRMLYQERMRRVDDRIFTAFDFPDCGQIRAKRPVSTTPLQALNLMNSDFVVEQSELLARRAMKDAGEDLPEQVTRCFELLFCRKPSTSELATSRQLAEKHGLRLLCRTLINTNEFAFLP
ncbi:MAG: PSD1 and planctomycete cytochrome C domain-containing protein [Planctomycetota bacterium]